MNLLDNIKKGRYYKNGAQFNLSNNRRVGAVERDDKIIIQLKNMDKLPEGESICKEAIARGINYTAIAISKEAAYCLIKSLQHILNQQNENGTKK